MLETSALLTDDIEPLGIAVGKSCHVVEHYLLCLAVRRRIEARAR